MKWILILGLTAACLTAPGITQVLAIEDSGDIERIVKSLGITKQDISPDLEILRRYPHVTARLLIDQLHPIPRKVYFYDKETDDCRHIIACLRALHYLTGTTFSARTRYKITDDEKQFLDFKNEMHDANHGHKLHFFGVWMSRDAEFVAPTDTQRSIIDQWKQWQNRYGDTFQHTSPGKPESSKDQWYWYG